jgi:hypothetical protein
MNTPKQNRRLVCDECGGVYQVQTRQVEGLPYEVYVCPKCGDTVFTLAQAEYFKEVSKLAELAKKSLGPLTLRQVGNSINATVPKELSDVGFSSGRQFQWEVQGPGVIALRLLSASEQKVQRSSKERRKPGAVESRKSRATSRNTPSKSRVARRRG